jgi:preprotein translocase subunit SecG
MFTFLLVVQALIAAILVGVILMQQSEGGGLGMGGSPSGLMSARGAANFLTRATGILAVSFVTLSIVLAVVATQKAAPTTIDGQATPVGCARPGPCRAAVDRSGGANGASTGCRQCTYAGCPDGRTGCSTEA